MINISDTAKTNNEANYETNHEKKQDANPSSEAARPIWMEDELVKGIPQEKLDFLSLVFQKGQGKSQRELMLTMMPLLQKAKRDNLSLTKDEMSLAIQAIKKHSLDDEIKQMDKMLQKAGFKPE